MMKLVEAFLTHFTYLALIMVLLAAGMGVPIPEDIPLIFSGYLCHPEGSPINDLPILDTNGDGMPDTPHPNGTPHQIPDLYVMMLAGMVGVLCGDSLVYFIGRRGIDSNNFVARHLRKVLHSERRAKAEKHFARHGNLTVFAGRFLPGFRSLVFAMAGMSKMPYPRFILIDGFAALISVPAFIYVGYHFARIVPFADLKRHIDHYKLPLGLLILAVLLTLGLIYLIRRNRKPALATVEVPVSSRQP